MNKVQLLRSQSSSQIKTSIRRKRFVLPFVVLYFLCSLQPCLCKNSSDTANIFSNTSGSNLSTEALSTFMPTYFANISTSLPSLNASGIFATAAPSISIFSNISNVTTFSPSTIIPVFVNATSAPSISATPAPVVTNSTGAPSFVTPGSAQPSSAPSKRVKTSRPTITSTEAPIAPPTPGPTIQRGSPTPPPSKPRPTAKPSLPLTTVTVQSIALSFVNVGVLDQSAINDWTDITERWFDESYNGNSRRVRSRSLQGQVNPQSFGVKDMSSVIVLRSQNVDDRSNMLVYDQTMTYASTDPMLTPDARELVSIPFNNRTTNTAYSNALSQNVNAFQDVATPIQLPIVGFTSYPTSAPANKSEGGLSLAAIIGIAVGGGVVLILLGCILVAMTRGKDREGGSGYVSAGTQPPSQFQLSAGAEDISTIDDTLQKVHTDTGSIAEYGDQSVATVDYDYSKAYGGGGDTSVVSSAGGTMGENTRHTAGDVAGTSAAARAALGASFDSETGYRESETTNVKEEVIVINAPAGKLGVVIDTPDDGAPVVHAVKDSSVIANQILVGDKLIAVDDEDVRSMTAIKVSKLISKKSSNPTRKLTIVRTTYSDE